MTLRKDSPWTEERAELLDKLWADGLSASQVAAQLGEGITRNAVIGRVHRMKAPQREKPISLPRTKNQRDKDRGLTQRFAKATRVERMVQQRDLLQAFAAPIKTTRSRKSLDLTFDELKWEDGRPSNCRNPQGEGPFLYCGQPIQPGSSYCPSCHARNYGRYEATPEQIARAAKMRAAKFKGSLILT